MSTPRPRALRSEHCPACDDYPGVGAFCTSCGVLASHPTSGDYAAPYVRRLAGELLDLLIFLLLPIWLYWMWFTSREGQSPAKSLLDLYVIAESGQPITPQRMWVRELLIKRLLLGLIGYLFTLLGPIINAGWILLNPDRQCVHDRMVGTLVVVRREPPELVQPSSDFDQQDVLLPPPAPRGPKVEPPPPAIRAASSSGRTGSACINEAGGQRPAPTSPELEALERANGRHLSQTEYERRQTTVDQAA